MCCSFRMLTQDGLFAYLYVVFLLISTLSRILAANVKLTVMLPFKLMWREKSWCKEKWKQGKCARACACLVAIQRRTYCWARKCAWKEEGKKEGWRDGCREVPNYLCVRITSSLPELNYWIDTHRGNFIMLYRCLHWTKEEDDACCHLTWRAAVVQRKQERVGLEISL